MGHWQPLVVACKQILYDRILSAKSIHLLQKESGRLQKFNKPCGLLWPGEFPLWSFMQLIKDASLLLLCWNSFMNALYNLLDGTSDNSKVWRWLQSNNWDSVICSLHIGQTDHMTLYLCDFVSAETINPNKTIYPASGLRTW